MRTTRMMLAGAALTLGAAGALTARPPREEIDEGDFVDIDPTSAVVTYDPLMPGEEAVVGAEGRRVIATLTDAPILAIPEPRDPSLPPDRLCGRYTSQYYNKEAMQRGVGVRINGKERTDVLEYCVSGGWARHYKRDGMGRVTAIESELKTTNAVVEPYYRRPPPKAK